MIIIKLLLSNYLCKEQLEKFEELVVILKMFDVDIKKENYRLSYINIDNILKRATVIEVELFYKNHNFVDIDFIFHDGELYTILVYYFIKLREKFGSMHFSVNNIEELCEELTKLF